MYARLCVMPHRRHLIRQHRNSSDSAALLPLSAYRIQRWGPLLTVDHLAAVLRGKSHQHGFDVHGSIAIDLLSTPI